MESVVYKDTPLGDYLQGEGEAEGDLVAHWSAPTLNDEPSPPPIQSYAPQGLPAIPARFRAKSHQPLNHGIAPKGLLGHFQTFSRAIHARICRAENSRFLEQFRFTIIGSQLLSEHVNVSQYIPGNSSSLPRPQNEFSASSNIPSINLGGVLVTCIIAFLYAWVLHFARGGLYPRIRLGRIWLSITLFAMLSGLLYAYIRRQMIHRVRQATVDSTALLVAQSQRYDSVATAVITLIQEVELVSRGYRISTPLPPITRIDERSQTRRCSKLRGIMQSSLRATIPLFAHACGVLQPLSTPDDLERFYEIYDISAADHLEMNIGFPGLEPDEEGTLKFLKMHFHRLHVTRKILFCCLLALDADGCKPDIARLGSVVPEVEKISKALGKWSEALENILGEEDFFSTPTAPKVPVTPAREKWRAQLRKLNSLSQGIRGLQAKLHILREESDKTLNESEDVTELGSNLMAQYDSIGCDLRALVHEWETSRTALALNIDKNEKRLSQSSSGLKSPALSLGGITSVDEGSPQDALNALNGFGMSARSSMDMSAEDVEMVFEAIALPRQRDRSSLTRGDRILKMKEERARVSMVRDKVEANTHMLRELESVINLRPRARTGASRITSL